MRVFVLLRFSRQVSGIDNVDTAFLAVHDYGPFGRSVKWRFSEPPLYRAGSVLLEIAGLFAGAEEVRQV